MECTPRWVQHTSKQGVKYEVNYETDAAWIVNRSTYSVPKVEYTTCDPPEQWIDVTNKCEALDGKIISPGHVDIRIMPEKYRLCKVERTSLTGTYTVFIVEQRIN